MKLVGANAVRRNHGSYRSRSLVAGALLLVVALCGFGATGTASAAAPTIVNQSSTGGQTNWLETFALTDDTSGDANRIWVSLVVKHDPGDKVTGVKIDDDYNGSDNTSSDGVRGVTAQQPVVVNGYDYSRVNYAYDAPTSNTGFNCPGFFGGNGTNQTTKPLRIRARLSDGQETATSSSNLKWGRHDCNSHDDMPRVFDRSQNKSSIEVGESVNFTFTGDDSDSGVTSHRDFGGIRWRLRRLSDGATTGETTKCWGNSDNSAKTLTVNFDRRGRWVLEAELRNSNDSCDANPYNNAWFYLGAVDVNSPASDSPNLTLNATRPQIDGDSTVSAAFDDADDNGQGGKVQDIEWDLDQNTGNGVSGFEAIQLGSVTGLASPQSKTVDTTGMTPGLKTVRARVTDNGAMSGADNIRRTKIVSTTFLVDTPPVAATDSVATETGAALPISLAASDADSDSLIWSIPDGPDHGSLSGTGSNRSYTPDPGFAGTDAFTFGVDDGYGGTDTAVVSITVDPNIDILTGPSGTVDSRGADVTFGSDATGATFECSLDSSAFAACSSPFSPTDLADGQHDVRVRAVASGLTSAHETNTWTIDAFPKIDLINGPDPASSMTSAAVEFGLSEDGVTVSPTSECRLDALAWSPCHSPKTYTDLDDGSHTISIRATDAFGKQVTEDVLWTITTGGSQTTIDAPLPDTFTSDDTAEINFSGTGDVASFECSLDGAAWSACTSPASLTGLADGTHTFKVRSIDSLGTPEELPAQVSWIVDGTPPVVTITSGPSGPVPAGPGSFSFHSNEGLSGFECSLDGANYSACDSPFRMAAVDLADGPHNFRVAATDRAGNRSLAAARDFRVLSVAPQVSLTGGPAQGAITGSNAATFGFTTTPAASGFECRVDDADWAPCGPPATMTGLIDGDHSFAVRAIDAVGNRSAEPTVRDWTVDTTPPETTINSGPVGQTDIDTADLAFDGSEIGSTFECSIDGGAFAACSSPASAGPLADGAHDFRVRATDVAGNRDLTDATRNWSVDTTEPPPPDPVLPEADPDPCTFLIEQDRCGDPYVVASARSPYRRRSGKAAIRVDIDSGGSDLKRIVARTPIGLRTKTVRGKRGAAIGRLVLTGAERSVVRLNLPGKRTRKVVVAGGKDESAVKVTLKRRTVFVENLPAGVTGAKIRLKATRGLRIVTSICGTRLWRTVLTDSSSNREDVDARGDIKCVRRVTR